MSFNFINKSLIKKHPVIKENCEDSLRQAIKNKLTYLNSTNQEIKEKVIEYLYLVR